MITNWANNLDMLSQNGVLDFDAASYITGQAPRYIGNPGAVPDFIQPLPTLPNQAKVDEFKLKSPEFHSDGNPAWKRWLIKAVILTLGTLMAYKYISKKGLKNIFKSTKPKQVKSSGNPIKKWFTKCSQTTKATSNSVKNFFVKIWKNLISKFKK